MTASSHTQVGCAIISLGTVGVKMEIVWRRQTRRWEYVWLSMASDKVLWRARPFSCEVTTWGDTCLVGQVKTGGWRPHTLVNAGLGISFGFLLVVVNFPGYPHMHCIPFTSFLQHYSIICSILIIYEVCLPWLDVERKVEADQAGLLDLRLETGARMNLRGLVQPFLGCILACRTGSQVHPVWAHPSSERVDNNKLLKILLKIYHRSRWKNR